MDGSGRGRRRLLVAALLCVAARSAHAEGADEPAVAALVGQLTSSADVRERGFWPTLLDAITGRPGEIALHKPYAVHVDRRGRVFVGDTAPGRLLVLDVAAHAAELWGGGQAERGGHAGAVSQPAGIASDPDGRIYVTDAAAARVVVFDAAGTFVTAFGGREQLVRPAGLAVDGSRRRLYVVDVGGHRLVAFDLSSGARVASYGRRGAGPGEFNYPSNVACAADGMLYVADTLNFRVQILDADGEFVSEIGGNCVAPGCLPRPKGLALDSAGRLFVADAARNDIQVFDRLGAQLFAFSAVGVEPGALRVPAGLAVGPNDWVYVADQANARVNIYRFLGDAEAASGPLDAR